MLIYLINYEITPPKKINLSKISQDSYSRHTFSEKPGLRFVFFFYAQKHEIAHVVLHAQFQGIFIVLPAASDGPKKVPALPTDNSALIY